MTSLISDTSITGIVRQIRDVMPPLFTTNDQSVLYQVLSGYAAPFQVNAQQINELYDKTFISKAIGQDLDYLIYDLTKIIRKDNESDANYRERYYKYVFRYNSTEGAISGAVNDILGYYPDRMVELGARNGYWGADNNSASGATYYYDDILSYPTLWASDLASSKFIGYIYLPEKPPSKELRDELFNVINSIRARGTTIYLVYPTTLPTYDTIYHYDDVFESHYS